LFDSIVAGICFNSACGILFSWLWRAILLTLSILYFWDFILAVPCGPGHLLYLLFQKDAASVFDREVEVIS
jgi:hypothetical protein